MTGENFFGGYKYGGGPQAARYLHIKARPKPATPLVRHNPALPCILPVQLELSCGIKNIKIENFGKNFFCNFFTNLP